MPPDRPTRALETERVRTMFTAYLLLSVTGIVLYIVIGATHN